MRKIEIFSDGACSGNPGMGGYGVILRWKEHMRELSGGELETTNNRMEMMGVIKGLQALTEKCDVTVFSDSKYVVNAVQKRWVYRWKQKGWMRNAKEPALNADLWQQILELISFHKVSFQWVKGHAGHTENERCDELAREAIDKLRSKKS